MLCSMYLKLQMSFKMRSKKVLAWQMDGIDESCACWNRQQNEKGQKQLARIANASC